MIDFSLLRQPLLQVRRVTIEHQKKTKYNSTENKLKTRKGDRKRDSEKNKKTQTLESQ